MGAPAPVGRFGKLDLLVLAAIVLAGAVNLPVPFHGDQALFTLGAARLGDGAVLYRDFWDLKQPGIFGFYLLGGKLLGFREVGIHAFELLYLTAFSAVLIVTLKGYYRHPWLASLVPLLTVGVYYGVAGSLHLTQVEGLVGFPLYVCAWSACAAVGPGAPRSRLLILSGAAGGVVLVFKLMFLLLLGPFWLTVLVAVLARRQGNPLGASARLLGPIALGLVAILLPVVAWFARTGTLGLAYETFFVYPPRVVAELPASGYGVLLDGLLWASGRFAPLLALAFLGAFLTAPRRWDLLTVNLVVWCVLGVGVILLQRRSWWGYHYLLLLPPLGILAARGLDVLWDYARALGPALTPWQRRVAAGSVVLLFAPALSGLAQKAVLLPLALSSDEGRRSTYLARFNADYATAVAETAFLAEPGNRPGDIYVCGSPVYYHASGRGQAVALNGWALELYLPEQWRQLARQLADARPPYVFVEAGYADLIPQRSPETVRFLDAHYRVLRRSAAGVWYGPREDDTQHPL
jgi:hypothetical protein